MTTTTTQVTRVGFSGSREGMSEAQRQHVHDTLLLICMNVGPVWFHHGDCIGADEQSHKIAKELGYKIKLHPPLDPKYRANLDKECDIVDQCWSYHGRNQRILKDSQLLIATPKTELNMGGGTWYTIERAIQTQHPYIIFFPDGRVKKDWIL